LTNLHKIALNASVSQAQSYGPAKIPYSVILGGVIEQERKQRGWAHQGRFGEQLGLSASAYSRIESGNTAVSVTQLRQISYLLQINAQYLLTRADAIAQQLQAQGVQITHEKRDNSAAILLGLGILAAALLAAGSATN
jgi:transcriptional regulator with XRE-family HTH domain